MSIDHTAKRLSVTVPEALRITGLGRTKLYELIGAGKVRVAKVGTRTLVNFADLERVAAGDVNE